jgi:hypothetical protein
MGSMASTPDVRRVRWWRVVLWAATVLLGGLALTGGLAWFWYRSVASDLARSNAGVSTAVNDALGSRGTRSAEGTVLVAAPRGGIPGIVLIRTDASGHRSVSVELRSNTRLAGHRVADFVTRGDIPGLLSALGAAEVDVRHVILLRPGRVDALIDAMGGVAIESRGDTTLRDTSGRLFHVPSGRTRLSGARSDAYLYGQIVDGPGESLETRQLRAMDSIGHAVLEPSSSVMSLRRIASALAKHAVTDLSAREYAGELQLWGNATHAVVCTPRAAPPGAALALLAGSTQASSHGCVEVRTTPPAVFRKIAVLGADPWEPLTLATSLLLLGFGLCVLVLEITSPGFRLLRTRLRAEDRAAGGVEQPGPASAIQAARPESSRSAGLGDRPRAPRGGRLWAAVHARRVGAPARARWTFRSGLPVPRRSVHGSQRSVASYAGMLAVAVGFGFAVAHLLGGG